MAVRQSQSPIAAVETPYAPLPVSDLAGEVDVSSLDQELARISDAMRRLYSGGAAPTELAAMMGTADSMVLDATPKIITGIQNAFRSTTFIGSLDPVAGTIELPMPNIYRVTASAQGDQGNNSFNEAAFLFLRIAGSVVTVDLDLAGYEIPNNKTTSRSWNSTRLIPVTDAPVTLSIGLYATSGLGTFNFVDVSFDVSAYNLQARK